MGWRNFWVNTVAASDFLSFERRFEIYKDNGLKSLSDQVFIQSRCHFVYPKLSNIWMGDRVFLNHSCYLENGAAISLFDNVCLAPFVRILTTTHLIGGSSRRVGESCDRRAVIIDAGSWVGAGAIVLPGVAIGPGCVIAAGSVVVKSCEPNGLYAGTPARRVKDLPN